MPSITPSLWFDRNLEEAATFYTSVFPNSHIEDLNRSTDAGPGEPGSVLSGSFVLDGTPVHRDQRWPPLPVQRGGVLHDQLQGPGRGRLLLGPADRRRPGIAVRLVQRPIRSELAGQCRTGSMSWSATRIRRRPRPPPRRCTACARSSSRISRKRRGGLSVRLRRRTLERMPDDAAISGGEPDAPGRRRIPSADPTAGPG